MTIQWAMQVLARAARARGNRWVCGRIVFGEWVC